MKSPVAHWGAREWQQNQDLLVPDPQHPQAFPGKCPTDLMGRIRVWITTEDRDLVAHGFGGQRIVLPGATVGAVHTASAFRSGGITRGQALLVLDHQRRILLRASGMWQTYGELAAVCKAGRLPAPSHLTPAYRTRTTSVTRAGQGRGGGAHAGRGTRKRSSTRRQVPSFDQAPGYQKLRTRPRGATLRVLALAVLLLLAIATGATAGAQPAVALPGWFGAVRTLIGIAGGLLGAAAGLWLALAAVHLLADGVRWGLTSWAVGTVAPVLRFFRRRERWGGWTIIWNVALVALVPALIGWGPGVGTASLTHGFRDAALVSQLRADGATTPGVLIDDQESDTDSDGRTTVHDVPTLVFRDGQAGLDVEATDPSIGGRPLPLDPGDPVDTRVPETVVYLPADDETAAARQQLAGSVWHGAPAANLVSGGLLTLALPPVLWLLVLRVRRRRWLRAKELVDDLAS